MTASRVTTAAAPLQPPPMVSTANIYVGAPRQRLPHEFPNGYPDYVLMHRGEDPDDIYQVVVRPVGPAAVAPLPYESRPFAYTIKLGRNVTIPSNSYQRIRMDLSFEFGEYAVGSILQHPSLRQALRVEAQQLYGSTGPGGLHIRVYNRNMAEGEEIHAGEPIALLTMSPVLKTRVVCAYPEGIEPVAENRRWPGYIKLIPLPRANSSSQEGPPPLPPRTVRRTTTNVLPPPPPLLPTLTEVGPPLHCVQDTVRTTTTTQPGYFQQPFVNYAELQPFPFFPPPPVVDYRTHLPPPPPLIGFPPFNPQARPLPMTPPEAMVARQQEQLGRTLSDFRFLPPMASHPTGPCHPLLQLNQNFSALGPVRSGSLLERLLVTSENERYRPQEAMDLTSSSGRSSPMTSSTRTTGSSRLPRRTPVRRNGRSQETPPPPYSSVNNDEGRPMPPPDNTALELERVRRLAYFARLREAREQHERAQEEADRAVAAAAATITPSVSVISGPEGIRSADEHSSLPNSE
ncbi:MAG: hypothetical protein ABSA72_12105 [Nitrososphaerales archaeon]